MVHQVVVQFGDGQQFRSDVDRLPPMAVEAARQWLESQFVALGGRPLRPTGKVLLADKVLVVAQKGGPAACAQTAWWEAYARAVHAALQRPLICVHVGQMRVDY